MASLPRLLIVDPTGEAAARTRAALTLLNRGATLIDVPSDLDALDELQYGAFALIITALGIGEAMDGVGLALHVRETLPETPVIVLAEPNDPDDLEGEQQFIYLRRPVDAHQFVRLVEAALDGRDLLSAAYPPSSAETERAELGAVPGIDTKAAQRVLETLLNDVGAMAVVLSSRAGEVLLERGAIGYIDREHLTGALLPTVEATHNMGQLVGGRASALLVYEGTEFNVFVLSAGLHYFLSVVFDAHNGNRALGSVNRYGRRAAEDLIALIDASVMIAEPTPETRKRTTGLLRMPPQLEEPIEPAAVPSAALAEASYPVMAAEEAPLMEPIIDLDPDLFDATDLSGLGAEDFDAMFDPDTLAQLANETRRERGPLSYEEARNLGLIP